jgi:hypothetical protein
MKWGTNRDEERLLKLVTSKNYLLIDRKKSIVGRARLNFSHIAKSPKIHLLSKIELFRVVFGGNV